MTPERHDESSSERDGRAVEEHDRRKAIEDTAGVLTGVYPPGYLEELRADWPD